MASALQPDGSLRLTRHLTIPAEEIEIRFATSGGPGGQHANRALTRVVVSFRVASSRVLAPHQRERLIDQLGPVARSQASRYRSQGQNREAALVQLAARLTEALAIPEPRRASAPTASSRRRRVDDKKARGRLKSQRGRVVEE